MSKNPNLDRLFGQKSETPARALDLDLDDLLSGPPLPEEEVLGSEDSSTIDSTRETACADPADWMRLVCGDVSPAEVEILLAHASRCAICSAQLRSCRKILEIDVTEEEASELLQHASASPEWSHRLAHKLARTPRKSAGGKYSRIYLWAGLGLAASVLLSAGIALRWQRDHAPERLLAEAYTSGRVFDLRMNGAAFAAANPGIHLRGGNAGHENAALREAETRIARHLQRAPNDPHWLQLQARADVLEEKFDSAVNILDRLLAAGPANPGLLVDASSAYFERGTCSGSESDRATALDYLRRADELAPDDPVVLFNEALVMEDRGQVINAIETWNRFLRFERDSRWLAEGRSHLNSLETKLNQMKSHQSRMVQHLAAPQGMLALAADTFTLASIDEELVTTLFPRLIEAAFPLPVDRSRGSPCTESCEAARALLTALAASLEQSHQDPWLSRFLPHKFSSDKPDFAIAARELSSAVDADSLGDYASALNWSLKSRELFRKIGNAAGVDRAEVEWGYALQRSSRMPECLQVASGILGRTLPSPWIQAQALTEKAVCNAVGGKTRYSPAAIAQKISEDHHYILLNLHARNILAAAAVESGDLENAWRINLGTLRMFYAGDYPAFRAYTTLAGLAEVEKSTSRVQLSLLLQHEVTGVLELTDSRRLIPAQRYDLADAAVRFTQRLWRQAPKSVG